MKILNQQKNEMYDLTNYKVGISYLDEKWKVIIVSDKLYVAIGEYSTIEQAVSVLNGLFDTTEDKFLVPEDIQSTIKEE